MTGTEVLRGIRFEEMRCTKLAAVYAAWKPGQAEVYRQRAELFRCAAERLETREKDAAHGRAD